MRYSVFGAAWNAGFKTGIITSPAKARISGIPSRVKKPDKDRLGRTPPGTA